MQSKIASWVKFAPLLLTCLVVSFPAVGANAKDQQPLKLTGVIEPKREVELASSIMGRIDTVSFDEGSLVKLGDVLVAINADELKAELASASASKELAKVEVNYKRKLLNRMRKLRQSKAIGADKLDEASFAFSAAEAKAKMADAQMAKIEAMLNETQIKAPFAGVVIKKWAEVGQITQPGKPLLQLEDHSALRLRILVKERYLYRLTSGDQLKVRVEAAQAEDLTGVVDKIIPSGDARTHTFAVDVDIVNPNEKLLPGMFGVVEIR
jgi:RND family efflux transporter MFP subunit